MTKKELIQTIAASTGHTQAHTIDTVNALIEAIHSELSKGAGSKVAISGLGVFATAARKGRKGRNPKNGEVIDIAATNVATFKASKSLKDTLKAI